MRLTSSDALLGRSLRFVVVGTGAVGTVGTPSEPSACVQSWRAPDTSGVTLTASTPDTAAVGQSVPVTATLDLGTAAVRAVGGLGGTVTFTLSGNGQTQTSAPVTYDGSTGRLSTTFGTVLPGRAYTVSASVSPPGHADAAVSVGARPVSTASIWPDLGVTATCQQSFLSCDLTVKITGVSSDDANGESFSLADGSQLRCGNAVTALTKSGFDPSTDTVTATVGQLDKFYGACTVTVALNEVATGTPFYGNRTSPSATASVGLGDPTLAALAGGDLTVAWNGDNGSRAEINYAGSTWTSAQLARLVSGWTEKITAPDGTDCGSNDQAIGSDPAFVTVSSDCVNRFGGTTDTWTITITYTSAVDGTTASLPKSLDGPVPGYTPPAVCAPTDFTASWGPTIDDGVAVGTSADATALAGCTDWTYELLDGGGTSCGVQTSVGAPPATISAGCNGELPGTGWQVVVTWKDTAGVQQQTTPPVDVTGDPPTA